MPTDAAGILEDATSRYRSAIFAPDRKQDHPKENAQAGGLGLAFAGRAPSHDGGDVRQRGWWSAAMNSNASFFGDLLTTIADRGRALLDRNTRTSGATKAATLVERCEQLLSGRGEASGVAIAREILSSWERHDTAGRERFLRVLAETGEVKRACRAVR